ncbi:SGNH/GDSL hydrolase family protein [Thermodesulfovibrio sp. TK110]
MAEDRTQRIVERKVSLAKEATSWVVRATTVDTKVALRIARNADRGIRILRQGLLFRFNADEVSELLQEYFEAVRRLNDAAQKICEKAGIPYVPPRELMPKQEMDKDTKVDKKMELAYGSDGDEDDIKV